LHVVLEGAQERYQIYALCRFKYVNVVNEDRVYYHKSGDQIGSLHAYHAKAEKIVPIRRNSEANEVA
jgi:hypothetical protein